MIKTKGPKGLTEKYVERRVLKEKYHENINNFLGIEFTDCISENKLIEKFMNLLFQISMCDKLLNQTNYIWKKLNQQNGQ